MKLTPYFFFKKKTLNFRKFKVANTCLFVGMDGRKDGRMDRWIDGYLVND